LRPAFLELPHCADVLLLAGDLTRLGAEDEIDVLVRELVGIDVPRVVPGSAKIPSNVCTRLTASRPVRAITRADTASRRCT